jgi:hypothetical protein
MTDAIALDDLLASITPETAAAVTARAPGGWLDQLHAATGESVALVEAVEQAPARRVEASAIDGWLRLGLLDAFGRWASGAASTCMHAPSTRHPQPSWSCAWRPDVVVCTPCLPLLRATGSMDRTCDRCGHVCAGLDQGDGIHAVTAWLGAFAYSAGACRECVPTVQEP